MDSAARSPYEILRLPEDFTAETLESAYMSAKNLHSNTAENKQEVEWAYAQLSKLARGQDNAEEDAISWDLIPSIPEMWKIETPIPKATDSHSMQPRFHAVSHSLPPRPAKTMRSVIGIGFKPVVPTRATGTLNTSPKVLEALSQIQTFDGTALTHLRNAAGITVDEMAGRTKISNAYLKALEQNSYNDLPAIVYMRGYLNSYLGYLGITDQSIVGKFAEHFKSSRH